jgi:uncharacterized membrane protein
MAVHLPIALVLIWPWIDLAGWLSRRPDVSRVGVALLVFAIPASLFAVVSGQAAFDAAIVARVSPRILETHSEDGDLVPWLLLVIAIVRIAGGIKIGRPARIAAIALGLALGVFVFGVGRSGGALVFEHHVGLRGTP